MRHEPDPATLRVGRVCGTAGSLFLGVALGAIVFAILDVVFPRPAAVTAAAAAAIAVGTLWFALPIVARARRRVDVEPAPTG